MYYLKRYRAGGFVIYKHSPTTSTHVFKVWEYIPAFMWRCPVRHNHFSQRLV